jgi:hypothetical protein
MEDVTAIARPVDRSAVDSAYRWLWLAIAFSLLAFGVGVAWDRAWHATHPFEDFWSPPHLFIYTSHLMATLALARIAVDPDLRSHFGRTLRLPLLGEIPAALVLAGGGLAVISLGGALDGVWHTRFGLDETGWSLPHSMLGSGILLGLLGFTAARFALADDRPLAAWTPAVFAALLIWTTVNVLLGPLEHNRSPEQVAAIARLPVLAATPAFQHTARIYEQWDLTRTSPLFIPLSALAVGIALALARSLVRPWWAFLLVALTATVLSGDRAQADFLGIADRQNIAPLPYVVPAMLFVAAAAVRAPTWLAWSIAGIGWALACAAVWSATLFGIVLAIPLTVVGAALGMLVARVVRQADGRVVWIVIAIGLAKPLVTGVIDLYLRTHTA